MNTNQPTHTSDQPTEYPMIRPKALDLLLVISVLLFFFTVMLWWAVGVNDDLAAESLMWIIGIAWMASALTWIMLFGFWYIRSSLQRKRLQAEHRRKANANFQLDKLKHWDEKR